MGIRAHARCRIPHAGSRVGGGRSAVWSRGCGCAVSRVAVGHTDFVGRAPYSKSGASARQAPRLHETTTAFDHSIHRRTTAHGAHPTSRGLHHREYSSRPRALTQPCFSLRSRHHAARGTAALPRPNLPPTPHAHVADGAPTLSGGALPALRHTGPLPSP